MACALRQETEALQPLATNPAIDLITTGLGGRRAVSSLQRELPARAPSLLIFTGIAGALSPDLSMGQVVFPEEWILESGESFTGDQDLKSRLRSREWSITGSGLTVRRPVLRSQTRRRLHLQTGALICDMEAAHALAVAREFEVPALVLKVVSDTCESNLPEFWRHLKANLELLRSRVQRLLQDLEIT